MLFFFFFGGGTSPHSNQLKKKNDLNFSFFENVDSKPFFTGFDHYDLKSCFQNSQYAISKKYFTKLRGMPENQYQGNTKLKLETLLEDSTPQSRFTIDVESNW